MKELIKVIGPDGLTKTLDQWQKEYKISGTQIGKHFSYTEPRFNKDLKDYGQLVVNELLIRVLDNLREELGYPISLTSFNRNQAKQDELTRKGYKTATYSPHMVFMAADIPAKSKEEVHKIVLKLNTVSRNTLIHIRIGFKQYLEAGMTFVHVDVCPEYYAKGKPYHAHPHPVQWESEITW